MQTKGKTLVLSMNTDYNLSSKRFYCVGSWDKGGRVLEWERKVWNYLSICFSPHIIVWIVTVKHKVNCAEKITPNSTFVFDTFPLFEHCLIRTFEAEI